MKDIAVKARHWKSTQDPSTNTHTRLGWNVTFKHNKKCQACERMLETNKFYCHATRRTYTIRSNFTFQCDTTWCVYFAVCKEHPCAAYVGQTFAAKSANSRGGLYKRHAGHMRDCSSGTGGLGAHYHEHHGGSTDTMQITIIDSTAPGNHASLDRLQRRVLDLTAENNGYNGIWRPQQEGGAGEGEGEKDWGVAL